MVSVLRIVNACLSLSCSKFCFEKCQVYCKVEKNSIMKTRISFSYIHQFLTFTTFAPLVYIQIYIYTCIFMYTNVCAFLFLLKYYKTSPLMYLLKRTITLYSYNSIIKPKKLIICLLSNIQDIVKFFQLSQKFYLELAFFFPFNSGSSQGYVLHLVIMSFWHPLI